MKTWKTSLTTPVTFMSLLVAAWLCGCTPASAQQSRVFLGGEMNVHSDIKPFETRSFTCTPIQPLSVGDHFLAMVSTDQGWARDTASDRQGHSNVTSLPRDRDGKLLGDCPVLGMVKTSDGKGKILFPAVLKLKIDIAKTNAISSNGYKIESKRPVQTGGQISVIVIGDALLSIGSDSADSEISKAKPWFCAFKDGMKSGECELAIEAWRIERQYIAK